MASKPRTIFSDDEGDHKTKKNKGFGKNLKKQTNATSTVAPSEPVVVEDDDDAFQVAFDQDFNQEIDNVDLSSY